MAAPQSPSVRIFPHVILRYTPRTVEMTWSSRDVALYDSAKRYLEHSAALKADRDQVLEVLTRAIGDVNNADRRGGLLKVRRRLYSGKALRRGDAELIDALGEAIGDVWRAFQLRGASSEAWSNELAATYEAASTVHAAAMFDAVRTDPELSRALSLTSQDLWKLVSLRPDRDWKILATMAHYFYRSHLKVSPLSRFSVMGVGKIAAEGTELRLVEGPGETVQVQMTGFMLGWLYEAAALDASILPGLPVTLNPTVRLTDETVAWYYHDGVNENLHQAAASDILLEVHRQFSTGKCATFRELRDSGAIQMSLDVWQQLLGYGYLIPERTVSFKQLNWAAGLAAWFSRIGTDTASWIVRATAELEYLRTAISDASAAQRLVALDQAQRVVAECGAHPEQILVGAGRHNRQRQSPLFERHVRRNTLYYENVCRDTSLSLPKEQAEAFCAALEHWCQTLPICDSRVLARRALHSVARETFGENITVSVLDLFAEVQRRRKSVLEAGGRTQIMGLDTTAPSLEPMVRLANEWCASVARAVLARSSGDIVYIHRDTLTEVGERLGLGYPASTGRGRSATVQVGRATDGTLVWVLHHSVLGGGFGQTISRFLDVLPAEVTTDLIEWNSARPDWASSVENIDASLFSGNAHPHLASRQVAVPGGDNNCEAGALVPVDQLAVSVRPDGMPLIDLRTGQQVQIVDLGFQTQGRSALFELLNTLSLEGSYSLTPIIEAVVAEWRRLRGSTYYTPRIVYDGNIVLRRRRWSLPEELSWKSASAGAWYAELVAWHQSAGAPVSLFYRCKNGRSTNERKPQFLNICDPVSCELLRHRMRSSDSTILIEEMFPSEDMLIPGPKGRHMVEATLTWDRV